MSSPENHREQAEHNERAARNTEHNYPDWAVTMYFYAALHWVERYAQLKGCNIAEDYAPGRSKHSSRRLYISDVAKELGSSTLYKAYEDLEKESRKARYLESLEGNARTYYTKKRQKVTESSQNLQKVKQLLQ